jgi:hypothetical protein
MAGILGMMALDIVLYFSAFLYLDQVLPSAYGVPQHPLFCFMPLMRLWRRRRGQVMSVFCALFDDKTDSQPPHEGSGLVRGAG